MASHYTAHVYEDMASVSDLMQEMDDDVELATACAAAEIGAALCLTRRAADSQLDFAVDLKERLPQVWEALAAGQLDVRRARTISYGTQHLPEGAARSVVHEIIGEASDLTTGQLSARLRRLCIQASPDDARQRYEDAVARRRVVCEATAAGTADLLAFDLPPHLVASITGRINRIAHSLSINGETRSVDQLRADILLDLLQGSSNAIAGTERGVVDIRVDLETLTGLSDCPGDLDGYGPVIADIARQVTGQQGGAEWRYTITHPDTGAPLGSGVTRRRPTSIQRRIVHSRDGTCVFPGCRMPASRCDLGHPIPYSHGGPTTVDHLAPLCRRHHRVRHHGWEYQPQPDGTYRWTSHLRRSYVTGGKPP